MVKKQYNTAARAALISYLKENTARTPQSAADIYRALSAKNAPGRSTVYRLLAELCDCGSLRRFRRDAEGQTYVYQYVSNAEDCSHHFHLQCSACGRIAHLQCGCSEEIRRQLLTAHGFAVDSGRSVLYGLCADCVGEVKCHA